MKGAPDRTMQIRNSSTQTTSKGSTETMLNRSSQTPNSSTATANSSTATTTTPIPKLRLEAAASCPEAAC